MTNITKNNYIFEKVSNLKGVGAKLSKYLKKKRIENINDLLWNLPYSYTDRSNIVTSDKLEIGKISTIKVRVLKYNFPRIRNLPNKILCEDNCGKIDIIYFNSREVYLKKLFPVNEFIVVSGKVNYFKNRYQITNPDYVEKIENINFVKQNIPKYTLTEGINEKLYRKIINQVLKKLPNLEEWLNDTEIKKFNFPSWKDSLKNIHNVEKEIDHNSFSYRRLAFDEILSHFIILLNNRKKIKKVKKKSKIFSNHYSKKIIDGLSYDLTSDQNKVLGEINFDLKSTSRMFRILQGDVGSGKTIVSFLACANTIEAEFQCAFMAPTEILARQHFMLAKQIFKNLNINIEFITGKTEYKIKKKIIENLKNGQINLIIGTHSLFQKKINFKKLGLIIIDEQHKFGVKQRIDLAKKGGDNCDVLLMSATPIPRTMMLTQYGDMDVSKIMQKPLNRKDILTLSKPENKIKELWPYIKKNIKNKNQVFWVCPLINKSKFLDYSSAITRFDEIKKKFSNKIGLLHGSMDKNEKEIILNKFLKKELDILVSTTVIEVGIDFPNANLIIIDNANKFGLAQLHQLRGRVGRGIKQGVCILLFKGSLSKNAIKRIKILKDSNDGFFIADEDMKLRGFGDVLGFQQSGEKYFRIADPVMHNDLFEYISRNINSIVNPKKNNFLLRLFDKAEVINDI